MAWRMTTLSVVVVGRGDGKRGNATFDPASTAGGGVCDGVWSHAGGRGVCHVYWRTHSLLCIHLLTRSPWKRHPRPCLCPCLASFPCRVSLYYCNHHNHHTLLSPLIAITTTIDHQLTITIDCQPSTTDCRLSQPSQPLTVDYHNHHNHHHYQQPSSSSTTITTTHHQQRSQSSITTTHHNQPSINNHHPLHPPPPTTHPPHKDTHL